MHLIWSQKSCLRCMLLTQPHWCSERTWELSDSQLKLINLPFRNHRFFWLKQRSSDNMKTFKGIERNCLQKMKPSSQTKLKLFSSEWCYRKHPWVISDGFDSFFPGSACFSTLNPPVFWHIWVKSLLCRKNLEEICIVESVFIAVGEVRSWKLS